MRSQSLKWFGSGLILLIVGVVWFFHHKIYDYADASFQETSVLEKSMAEDFHEKNQSSIQKIKQEEPVLKKRTTTEKAVVSDWLSRSGYRHSDRDSYEHYTDEQLALMSDQGDVNAMLVSIDRYIDKGDSISARSASQKAIVYGSLHAIVIMSEFLYNDSLADSTNAEEMKKGMIDAFAYNQFIEMRGDGLNYESFLYSKAESFKRNFHEELVFSAEEESQIKKRSQELYDYYQNERHKLGLGDFDNETPKEVKDFFGF